MATLSLQHLSKSYGAQAVVDDVSIDIADGEFVVLVGPSGCGKSTTLRLIAGLEAGSGTIRIGERVVNGAHPADRDVAMVFQNYALYPHMSVRDNLAYGLKRRKVPRADIARRVAATAAMLRLDGLLQRRPAQLSGGQRQRVALGRAIIREPAVFLMDEPLSNLDAKLRVEMRAELLRLHAELRVTTVYVTHDQVEAMTMGSRIVVMNAGRIEQIGRPLDVYREPASLFVARFVGLPEINIIPGRLTAGPEMVRFIGADFTVPLPPGVAPRTDDAVLLGLRPQSLFGTPEQPDPGTVALGMAKITAVEHHGPESFAACLLGGTALNLRIAPGAGVGIGSTIAVAADLAASHFFSDPTGRRIGVPPPSPA